MIPNAIRSLPVTLPPPGGEGVAGLPDGHTHGIVLFAHGSGSSQMRCERPLVTVPGVPHLFEEPGALEAVVDPARPWFLRHFAGEPGEAEHAVHRSA